MQLSLLQRAWRRIALHFGSSYTHPDGYLELDIEAAAGIDRADDDSIRHVKSQRYEARQRARTRVQGAALVGVGLGWLATYFGVPLGHSVMIGGLVAVGLWKLQR